jgi:hypothetical protein
VHYHALFCYSRDKDLTAPVAEELCQVFHQLNQLIPRQVVHRHSRDV